MSSSKPPRDMAAILQRRWSLVAVAVAAAIVAALVMQLATGDRSNVVVPMLVAAIVGLLLGLASVWLVETLDVTIRDLRDLAVLTPAPNLGVVPRHAIGADRPDDVAIFRDPNSIESEGYRSVRTALEFVISPPPSAAAASSVEQLDEAGAGGDDASWAMERPTIGKIVLVTSARPGEGKSSVAANVAAAAAMAGRRVVLVDADLRKPQAHRLFRLKNTEGLSSMLAGEVKGFGAVQRLEGVRRLVVLSSGPPPPDPAELLAHERLGLVLRSMAQKADLVVVDAPPLLAVTDPTIIAQQCDAVVMVATAEMSDRREWAEALRRLAVVGAEVVGTVLLRPDDRVHAVPTFRYEPSAVPKNWWVAKATEPSDAATTESSVAATTQPSEPASTSPADASEPFVWTEPSAAPTAAAWISQWPKGAELDPSKGAAERDVNDGWPVRRSNG